MDAELRDLTVYIGRFSPFHQGHAETLSKALACSRRVLVIIGSDKQPRTVKNPWTAIERATMIYNWHRYESGDDRQDALIIKTQRDHPYNNDRWLSEVQQLINDVNPQGDVWLTGCDRDESTFYLKQFPTFKLDIVHEDLKVSRFLSGTSIRDLYFGRSLNGRTLTDHEVEILNSSFIPKTTATVLEEFRLKPAYKNLVEEYQFLLKHERDWSVAPFPPTFQTVDAVVIQTGYVLLVNRRNTPGRGLWALPGGYIKQNEWMLDAAVRELIEETKIDVPTAVIYSSLKDDYVFEDPGRSLRGRIITRAFLFKLPDFLQNGRIKLPKVKGADDAAKARWFALSEIDQLSDRLFEDHSAIIETMVARLKRERR